MSMKQYGRNRDLIKEIKGLLYLYWFNICNFFSQRIDKILDQTADRLDTAQVRGLSSELPAEKIALLRTRVKKNLKNVVKSIEDDR